MNDHETPESAADPTASAPVPAPPTTKTSTRPGYRTSEFWVVAAALAIIAFNAFADRLSGDSAAACAAAATAIYTLVRFVIKVSNNITPEELASELHKLAERKGERKP